MRRLGVIVALGALLGMLAGVVTASPAVARGHKWQLVPNVPITLPTALCGFKIRGVPTVNKQFAKVLKAPDGSMTLVITGSFKASFTNPGTGKTITLNLSGPGKVTVHTDGSITAATHGHSIVLLMPADAKRFGLPGVSVTTGGLRFSETANGAIASLSLHGHVLVNVCAALS
jgi:hypothetical protein